MLKIFYIMFNKNYSESDLEKNQGGGGQPEMHHGWRKGESSNSSDPPLHQGESAELSARRLVD